MYDSNKRHQGAAEVRSRAVNTIQQPECTLIVDTGCFQEICKVNKNLSYFSILPGIGGPSSTFDGSYLWRDFRILGDTICI
jgi:hypothetical protein